MSVLWALSCRYCEMFRHIDITGIVILLILLAFDCRVAFALATGR